MSVTYLVFPNDDSIFPYYQDVPTENLKAIEVFINSSTSNIRFHCDCIVYKVFRLKRKIL